MISLSEYTTNKLYENELVDFNIKPLQVKRFALNCLTSLFDWEDVKLNKYIDKFDKFQASKSRNEFYDFYMNAAIKGKAGKRYFIKCKIDMEKDGNPDEKNIYIIYTLNDKFNPRGSKAMYVFDMDADELNKCILNGETPERKTILTPSKKWYSDTVEKFINIVMDSIEKEKSL